MFESMVGLFTHQQNLSVNFTRQVGGVLALLRTVLVDGVNLGVVDDLSVTDGVATVSTYTPHKVIQDAVVRIANNAQSALNGDKKIIATTAQTYQFLAPGVANGNYTGLTTHTLAPLGWQEVQGDATTAIFKSKSYLGHSVYFYIDDQDSIITKFYLSQSDHTLDWVKQNLQTWRCVYKSNAQANPMWMLCGDAYRFYIHAQRGSSVSDTSVFFIGRLKTKRLIDHWGIAINGDTEASMNTANAYSGGLTRNGWGATKLLVQRHLTGQDLAATAWLSSRGLHANIASFISGSNMANNNTVGTLLKTRYSKTLVVTPVDVLHASTGETYINDDSHIPRGSMPGLYHQLSGSTYNANAHFERLPVKVGTTTKNLLILHHADGYLLLDTKGPW